MSVGKLVSRLRHVCAEEDQGADLLSPRAARLMKRRLQTNEAKTRKLLPQDYPRELRAQTGAAWKEKCRTRLQLLGGVSQNRLSPSFRDPEISSSCQSRPLRQDWIGTARRRLEGPQLIERYAKLHDGTALRPTWSNIVAQDAREFHQATPSEPMCFH